MMVKIKYMRRLYVHANGYSAILYGKSGLAIVDKDGKTVIQTGYRKANTEEEILKMLGETPEFLKMLDDFGAEIYTDID